MAVITSTQAETELNSRNYFLTGTAEGAPPTTPPSTTPSSSASTLISNLEAAVMSYPAYSQGGVPFPTTLVQSIITTLPNIAFTNQDFVDTANYFATKYPYQYTYNDMYTALVQYLSGGTAPPTTTPPSTTPPSTTPPSTTPPGTAPTQTTTPATPSSFIQDNMMLLVILFAGAFLLAIFPGQEGGKNVPI